MKKAITILAVLIVLVGAVFAAETHKISVKANVEETLPAFNLTFGDLDTNEDADNVYGINPTPNYNKISHTVAGAEDVNFDLDEGGSFKVLAQVINNVKTNKSFTIKISGGVFSVVRDTTEGYHAPSSIALSDEHGQDASVKSVGNFTNVTNANTKIDTSEEEAVATVAFTGKTGTGETSAIPVLGATFTYAADKDINPNTGNGDAAWYYADITMTVTQP